jgi:hypothetical protein
LGDIDIYIIPCQRVAELIDIPPTISESQTMRGGHLVSEEIAIELTATKIVVTEYVAD